MLWHTEAAVPGPVFSALDGGTRWPAILRAARSAETETGEAEGQAVTNDLGIVHSASLFVELHGANATQEARQMAAKMRARGDLDSADSWLRIIVAIGELERRPVRRPS